MSLLDVTFDFDDRGRIIKVNWSDETWDIWTYHKDLTPQQVKQVLAGKLAKEIVSKAGKEDIKQQSDGSKYKMVYDRDGTLIRQDLLTKSS